MRPAGTARRTPRPGTRAGPRRRRARRVGQPVGGQHLEPVTGTAYHRGVEGTCAEVVHHKAGTGRQFAAYHVDEVGGRGDRFGYQTRLAEVGPASGGEQHGAATRSPGGRVGEADAIRGAADRAYRLSGDPAE